MNAPIPGVRTAIALMLISLSSLLQAQTNIVRIGSIPSAGQPAALKDGYLYCVNQPGLRIFNVANPTNAIDVGYRTTSSCDGIAFAGTYAYAIFIPPEIAPVWLQIFDASNPTNLVPVSRINQNFIDFCVVDQVVYLFYNDLSRVYDISDPINPRFVAASYPGIRAAAAGNYLYVTTPTALSVRDITTPTNPVPVASVAMTNDFYARINISGNLLFVAGPRWQTVFDISSRTNPVPIRRLLGTGHGVAISGNYCYLGGTNIDIYNITDPTNALHVASTVISSGTPRGIMLARSGYAYFEDFQMIVVCSLGQPPPPELRLSTTATNTMTLSWPAPSPAFAVQQTPDLAAPNWTRLPQMPMVAGRRNQVVVPPLSGTTFYRLVSE